MTACSGAGHGTMPPAAPPPFPAQAGSSVQRFPEIQDSDIDAHIDAQLPADERAIMHRVMLHLRKTGRFNVVYFALDGRNYSNHVALRDAMRRAVEVAPGRYRTSDGGIISGPPDDPFGAPGTQRTPQLWQPPSSSGSSTGAFRRVVSPSGYSYVAGTVYVPCNASNYAAGEGGYEMFGGWGAVNRDAADAGLEHYLANQPAVGNAENLAVFIKYQPGGAQVNGSYFWYTEPVSQKDIYVKGYGAHLHCGQTIAMYFYPSPDGVLNIEADGYVMQDGTYEGVTAVYNTPGGASEWPMSGGGANGMVVKRFTGLAQPNGLSYNGSTEGIVNGNPAILWDSVELGTQGGSISAWTTSNFPATRFDTSPCANAVPYALYGSNDRAYAEYNGIQMRGC